MGTLFEKDLWDRNRKKKREEMAILFPHIFVPAENGKYLYLWIDST